MKRKEKLGKKNEGMKRTEKKNNKKKEKKTSVWKSENETIKIERK